LSRSLICTNNRVTATPKRASTAVREEKTDA
jgi:hypothetical protein